MIVRPYRFASLGDERQGHRRERQAEPGDPPGALTKDRNREQHGHRRIQGHDDASVKSVFTDTVNNTGFFSGKTGGFAFFFFVVPLSFILTQYTITGYDASAHLSEETHQAANSAAKGIWRSIFYSGIAGWIVLLTSSSRCRTRPA